MQEDGNGNWEDTRKTERALIWSASGAPIHIGPIVHSLNVDPL